MTQSGADDFEQDFDEATLQRGPPPKASFAKNLSAAWQGSPLFKMFVLVVVVIAVTVAIIAIFSGPERDRTGSSVKGAPNLSDTPGAKAPPAYVEAVQDASIKRAEEALQQGKSAIPTPVSGDVSNTGPGDEADQSAYDPLAEFRPNIPAEVAQPGQQVEEPVELIDSDLLGKMQQQMNALFDSWHPKGLALLQVVDPGSLKKNPQPIGANTPPGRVIVPAGSMYYGQMLMEANSDAPGPILAEILSGPFTGGRAIGQFEVTRDYLVIHFTKISYRKHDYNADILAVDPNTTLGALVTEKDSRYFSRVVLPTAAAFLEGFGQALSSPNQRVVNGNGDVLVLDQGRQGIQEGLYRGLSESMGTVGGFFREEAAATKPLVRVAVGTPMGLFFVNGVTDDNRANQPIQTPVTPQPSVGATPVSSVNPVISGGLESASGNSQSPLANGGLNIIQSTPK